MPMFDFKCPVCDVVDEVYVSGIHTAVYCEQCAADGMSDGPEMERQKYGGRTVFEVEGYNAHNRYGLDWPDNPSDIRARGLT